MDRPPWHDAKRVNAAEVARSATQNQPSVACPRTHRVSMVTTPPRRSALGVIALCWLIVVFDGYDLIVYGTTIPALLEEPGWDLTPASAGTIGSLAFAGMLIGALGRGPLADRLGRRRTILVPSCGSRSSPACAASPRAPEVFGLLRFLAGLGLGGLVPSANALTAEFVGASAARSSRR